MVEDYEVIEDPEVLFNDAFEEIQEERRRVMEEMQMNSDEVDDLVKEIYPIAYKRVWGELHDRIDTDIWGKYVDGVLTAEELEGWKKDLELWKAEWLRILKKIRKK